MLGLGIFWEEGADFGHCVVKIWEVITEMGEERGEEGKVAIQPVNRSTGVGGVFRLFFLLGICWVIGF